MKAPAKLLAIALVVALIACGDKNTESSTETHNSQPAKTAEVAPASSQGSASQTLANQSLTSATVPVQALSIEEGKKRYEATCKVCHEQGLLDAPRLSDKATWAKRLEKGMDTLYQHSAKGFNKMPAQAVGDVSEAEVYAAVDYMIAQVK